MTVDESKLITETLAGKTESFGMIVEKYQNTVFNLAYRITRDKDISKDIAQDSFIKAYKNLKNFDITKNFFSWIYRIALNESLNNKKHSVFSEPMNENHETDTASPEDYIEKNEAAKMISQAINKLEDKYRSLIILKHFQDLSYDEISEIMNLPAGKVKSRLYIARDILRQKLEKMK